jgi:hypothetical protein
MHAWFTVYKQSANTEIQCAILTHPHFYDLKQNHDNMIFSTKIVPVYSNVCNISKFPKLLAERNACYNKSLTCHNNARAPAIAS